MSNKSIPVLLALILVCVVYNSWTVATLRSDLRKANMQNQPSPPPSVDSQVLNTRLIQIQQNQVSMSASLGYLELLTVGVVRKMELPLDEARAVFEKRPEGLPNGWTWQEAWGEMPASE